MKRGRYLFTKQETGGQMMRRSGGKVRGMRGRWKKLWRELLGTKVAAITFPTELAEAKLFGGIPEKFGLRQLGGKSYGGSFWA